LCKLLLFIGDLLGPGLPAAPFVLTLLEDKSGPHNER